MAIPACRHWPWPLPSPFSPSILSAPPTQQMARSQMTATRGQLCLIIRRCFDSILILETAAKLAMSNVS